MCVLGFVNVCVYIYMLLCKCVCVLCISRCSYSVFWLYKFNKKKKKRKGALAVGRICDLSLTAKTPKIVLICVFISPVTLKTSKAQLFVTFAY